ncbi:hypothetical protein E3T46_01710 [Cryobacterium sp. Hh11]|uniref:hypothetical protein n=1 Tax=Cryobacterium sp. Hh11 TaxID=2555868 RepID=UPI00106A142D|nr:hypothetical protein [Cryobacterium sp. Hh11]TFD54100.1 hypothetical protein E3T46_01710 [Cryobacterium sp. Hh11]
MSGPLESWQRYQKIVTNHGYRLVHENVDRVAYFCTSDAHRAITREADRRLVRTEHPRLVSYPCLDARGIWIGPNLDPGDHAVQREAATQLDGPEAPGNELAAIFLPRLASLHRAFSRAGLTGMKVLAFIWPSAEHDRGLFRPGRGRP